MSGLDLLREMNADARLATLPVVALTASLRNDDADRAYDLGVRAFLPKPLDVATFSRVVVDVSQVA